MQIGMPTAVQAHRHGAGDLPGVSCGGAMRETHAHCVRFTRSATRIHAKTAQNGAGTILVKANGLIMKLRGMMQNPGTGVPDWLVLSSAQKLFCLSI
jgi:hypothetical protein